MKDPIFRTAVQWYGRLAGFILALALVFVFVNLSQGQSGTGTVDVQLTVTATAGPIRCTITPSQSGQAATMTCQQGGLAVTTTTITPAVNSTGILSSVSVPAGSGFDSVTTLLRKTTATAAVQWEVTANGVTRSGTF